MDSTTKQNAGEPTKSPARPDATDRVIYRFVDLFDGNRSATGTEEGGCSRVADPEDWCLDVEGHLRMGLPIGVYPMTTIIDDDWTTVGATHGPWRWTVKWGCIDFDEGDEASWVHASNVHSVLAQLGTESWIERSRSKGYHVWVFLDHWGDPDTVRRALLGACQIVAAPTKEINPKQVELPEGSIGNYVRLPYPGALARGAVRRAIEAANLLPHGRRTMVSPADGEPIDLSSFVSVASETLVSADEIELLASYYIPPRQLEGRGRDWSRLEGDAVTRLAGKARIIFEQGPIENPDSPTNYRGQTLWKLARYLVEDGKHTPDEALVLLRDADERWGKFHDRPDGDRRLQEMVDKAFGGNVDPHLHNPGQAEA